MVSPAVVVARCSASDSNFRSGKENGSACYGRSGNGIPRPILIFVAAEKNGFACRTGLLMLRFLISGGKLGNRYRDCPGLDLLRAAIRDFRPRLGNRCKLFQVYTIYRASILDFRPRLGNRCKVFPVYTLFRASILDFRPRLENRCRV